MKRLLTLITLVLVSAAFVFVAPTTAIAAGKGGKGKKSTPIPVDTNDKITAVHLSSITVGIFSPSKSVEYKVTPQTKITVNGIETKLSGLTTGMDVTVKAAADGATAESIDAKTAKH